MVPQLLAGMFGLAPPAVGIGGEPRQPAGGPAAAHPIPQTGSDATQGAGAHSRGELQRLWRSYQTVRLSLWAVAGVIVLLGWTHFAQLMQASRERDLLAAANDLANLTRVCEEHAERTLGNAEQVLAFVRERYLAEHRLLDLAGMSQRGVIDTRSFNQVGIIDPQGQLILSSQPLPGPLDLSDREHFQAHQAADTGALHVSRPVIGRLTGKWTMHLSRRINLPGQGFGGVAGISMDPNYFGDFYRDLQLGHHGVAALYGMDGIARARRAGDQVDFGMNAANSPMYRHMAGGQVAGSYVNRSVVDGVERLFHFRRLVHYPLVVVAGMATEDIYANHERTRSALVLQAGLASAVVLLLAAVLDRNLRRVRRETQVRDLAAQQLRDRTEQLHALFHLSPDGYVILDRGGRVVFINPACGRLLGGEVDRCLGYTEAQFVQWLRARCQDDRPIASLEDFRPEPRRPAWRPATLTVTDSGNRVLQALLLESDGQKVSRILYLRDVTREAELDQIKSEFLSTAAHELRTPMASILGFSEVLALAGPVELGEAERQEFLTIIHEQSKAMTHILDELLDLARMEARRGKDFRLAPVDLVRLIGDLVRALPLPAGRQPPRVLLPERLPALRADVGKLRQALLNVLSNAYKYSPAGGAVDLQVEQVDDGAGPTVVLRVSDHGIGMTPEQVRHVCERFYRADKSGRTPGTGLGMSIVKEIVELHDGSLEIRSEAGHGTTVSLLLPVRPLPMSPLRDGSAVEGGAQDVNDAASRPGHRTSDGERMA